MYYLIHGFITGNVFMTGLMLGALNYDTPTLFGISLSVVLFSAYIVALSKLLRIVKYDQ